MPISLSVKKSLRSSQAKRKMNLVWKKKYKEVLKPFLKKPSKAGMKKLSSVLDKLSKNNIFHKNKVARIKSRYSKKMSKS